jgi:transposase
MASSGQLHLMTSLLNSQEFKVVNYQFQDEIGIFLHLEKKELKVKCPGCGNQTDKLHQNHWHLVRDLAFGEQKVYLRVNRRQMRCEKCGQKFSEELTLVKKRRNYTERLRDKIITEVLESDIKNVASRYGFSEQEVETMLQELGVELIRKKPQELRRLGMDEIAVVKGQKNYYVVLIDIDKGVLVGIIEKRKKEDIEKYLKAWGQEVLERIEEVSIDFWKTYKEIAEKLMPQAEIVADRFHAMKQVQDELDQERRKIKRTAKKMKKKKEKEKILSGLIKSKYVLLKNEKDLKDEEIDRLKIVKEVVPKLGKMHELKEKFRNIFETKEDWVAGLFELSDWLKEAHDYFPNSCGTIRRWIGEIIAYFDHGTTQGVVEGINNKLKLIKRRGYGFRNFDNFQIRSLLTWHFAS